MPLFQDIINKVKGKKKVNVKEHLRQTHSGLTRVEHYTKFIEEEPKEININELDDDMMSVKEEDILDEVEMEPDENIKLTKGEMEVLPKVEPHELPTLIKNWQDRKDEQSLLRILKTYDRLLHFHASKYKTTPIPYNLILLESKRWLIKAVETYNPNKKASFNTHLTNYLRKLFRFAGVNQNIAKIPEQRIRKINIYKTTMAKLEDRLGREPTDAELSDELSWSVKEVQRLRNELGRAEILNFGEDYSYGDLGIDNDKISKALKIVYYDGSKEEKFIIEHTTKIFGKKQHSTPELAQRLKISDSKVKSIMSNINKKIIEIA
jgi:DNA-directed RNA polymerase sigma subunit (sigma70/sigma32)